MEYLLWTLSAAARRRLFNPGLHSGAAAVDKCIVSADRLNDLRYMRDRIGAPELSDAEFARKQADRQVKAEELQNRLDANRQALEEQQKQQPTPELQKLKQAAFSRTTDICESLNGRLLRLDSQELAANTPPLHFQCRAVLSPVTAYDLNEMEKHGWKDAEGRTLDDLVQGRKVKKNLLLQSLMNLRKESLLQKPKAQEEINHQSLLWVEQAERTDGTEKITMDSSSR